MRYPTLLPEIGLLVIDELGSEERSETFFPGAYHLHALASCARTCKDWLHRSRVNLYRTIYITDRYSIKSLRHAFSTIPSLPALVETVKSTDRTRRGDHVKLYEVVQFISEVRIPRFKGITIHGEEKEDWSISVSNPRIRAALYTVPYSSLHTLGVSCIPVSRVLFLLRAFTSLNTLRCYEISEDDDRKAVYPRHLSLSAFEVSAAAFIRVCVLTPLGVVGGACG